MAMLTDAPLEDRKPLPRRVRVLTAGSPPPAAMLETITTMGFDVDHVFGITEVSGTPVTCARQHAWDDLPVRQRSRLQSRQGVRAAALEGLMVADPETLEPVPRDGQTAGEILIRGNTVMKGYLKNPASTVKAFAGGWFHTGDIAVVHPDGYLQITDREKDIIISGGENISSVEVEDVLHQHPAVLSAAVVAKPDDKWGEVPCAFVQLKAGAGAVTDDEVIAFCRDRLAKFKCPREVRFITLPKTATGKIQKFRLREMAGSREAITRAGRRWTEGSPPMTMTLYHCMSARSFRPLWMLEELGLPYELKVLPFPPRVKAPSYLEINPLGTIPAFFDGATRMTESAAICHFLAARHSPRQLNVETDESEFGAYLNFLHFGEATLTFPQTLVLRYSRFEAPDRQQPQTVEDYKIWFLSRLRTLSPLLASNEFVCSQTLHRSGRICRLRAPARSAHRAGSVLQAGGQGLLGKASAT